MRFLIRLGVIAFALLFAWAVVFRPLMPALVMRWLFGTEPEFTQLQIAEVFRDLFAAFLALALALGVLIWALIRFEIRGQVEQIARRMAIHQTLHTNIAFSYHYGVFHHHKGEAIEYANMALSIAKEGQKQRPPPILEEHFEKNVVTAKNNLAYFLAEHHRQETEQGRTFWAASKQALSLAREVYKAYRSGARGFDDPDWLETYYYVRATFAKDLNEAREIASDIKRLMKDDTLATIRKKLEKSLGYLQKTYPSLETNA